MKRIVAVAGISATLLMLLYGLGTAMASDWSAQAFSDHLQVSSPSTEILSKGQAGAKEGTYAVRTTTLHIVLNDSVTVNALLREPIAAPGKRPACLFLQGAGTGTAQSVYGDLASGMASAGIVTLVPDKRMDDYSTLHRDYATMAHDYGVSLDVLRHVPNVSAAHTGIYAESEGTWVTTMMTAEHPDLAFAILTSPPVFSGRQQMTMAASAYLNAAGAPRILIDDVPKFTSMDFSVLGLDYADFPAGRYLTSLKMPLLVNYGVNDPSMPIEQGARRIIDAAAQTGNRNVTVRFYPTNHQMRVGSQLSKPGLPLDANYTKNLENWVNGVAAGASSNGWQTPMVAGAQPDQRFAAPQERIAPGLITSLQALLGLITASLATTVMAVLAASVLAVRVLVAKVPVMKSSVTGLHARRRSASQGLTGKGSPEEGSACASSTNERDDTGLAIAARRRQPEFGRGVGRILAAAMTLTAASMLGFGAYLLTLVRAALQLRDQSTLLNTGWWAIRIAALLLVVLLSWLIEQVFMNRLGHVQARWETILARGFGHRFTVVASVSAILLWLILLAFWGAFGY